MGLVFCSEVLTSTCQSESVVAAHRQLPLSWRHLIPQNLQVLFEAGILWVLPQ
jgi:hypothetical protein